ncbi:MAG: AGE family epimerase/isomerase [Chitinophagales bacterium]|nr:AGE family epimerase/isomerase [Chitinophagales bacterium]
MEALTKNEKRELPISREELSAELDSILSYWLRQVVDPETGNLFGSVDFQDIPDRSAPRGIVMYSRVLWAFSAAFGHTGKPEYKVMAELALKGIIRDFLDGEYGGVYWSVGRNGNIIDGKKQIYGLAFCIYGLSEYYRISQDPKSLELAKQLYRLIEKYGFDTEKNGYIEAFTRQWMEMGDLRLSEKDQNERKTMNTHLHVVEAYANLYSVWPDDKLRERVQNLLALFDRHFVDPVTGHLHLFFNDDWESKSKLISYGHDIEAAWLLPYCAAVIGDKGWVDHFNKLSVRITDAAARGVDEDGGLWYEFDPETQQLVMEKHSWPQAEALLGFYHAWKQSGTGKYLFNMRQTWQFIQEFIKDKKAGEWYWGVMLDHTIMKKDKAGFWKCPYHNSRAMLELLKEYQ